MNCLIIGKVWPEPNSSAAGRRMLQLIDTLSQVATIHFATTANRTGFEDNMCDTSAVIHQIELNSDTVVETFRAINPKIVVFDRFMTEEQFGWRIMELFPEALRILNTEDIHFLRKARENAVLKNQEVSFEQDDTFRELASIYRCDLTLVVSEFERDFLVQDFCIPADQIHYFPLYSEGIGNLNPPFENRRDFVFIGNFLHSPNLDCVKYLKSEIWPELFKADKLLKLHVYGAYPPKQIQDMHNPKEGFYVHGRAESQFDVLKNARVLLAPLRFGAGMKGKFLEAMECETPVVTTAIGAESMCLGHQFAGAVRDKKAEIVEQSILLYHDEVCWNQANTSGSEILQKKYDFKVVQAAFLNRLNESLKTLNEFRKQHITARIIQHQSLLSNRYMAKWIMLKNR